MRVVAWLSSKVHEQELGRAIGTSVRLNGDEYEWRPVGGWQEGAGLGDCGVLVGIHTSRQPMAEYYREAGVPYIHLDKGFTRDPGDIKTEYWRWAVSGHQPTRYLPKLMASGIGNDDTRRLRLGWLPSKRKSLPGGHVIYCAPSGRTLGWYDCLKPDEEPKAMEARIWREDVKRLLKTFPSRTKVYFRPKPPRVKELLDWQIPPGAELDAHKIPMSQRLMGAQCLATWTSVAGVEAIMGGIPVLALHETAARPVAASELTADPPFPSSEQQRRWLNALAWCQFSWSEWPEAFAWKFVRKLVVAELKGELA